MATKLKTTIGSMPCLCCGVTMPVKQAENGTLDLSCKDCDFSAYAKTGTAAHRHALGRVKLKAAGMESKPEPKTAPEPAPKVTAPTMAALPATKRNTLFG